MEAELENIGQRLKKTKVMMINVESDAGFSEENIDMNDFDSLSEQSISDKINEQNEENEENEAFLRSHNYQTFTCKCHSQTKIVCVD